MNRELHFTKSKEEVSDHAKRFWGHDDIVLTREDVDKMLDGYFIYYDDGEYSTSLSVGERKSGMKESAPKEVVDFINEKIEQDWTLGQVAEYFYHIMEFESTWSNFPYPVKWGRLNFTLFAELWIDRLKEVHT